jgi:putative spermidine/putrescine transport system permease protein
MVLALMKANTGDTFLKYLFRIILLIIYLYLLAPVIIVVLVSFNPTESLVIPTTGLSLKWYQEFLNIPGFVDAFKFSLKLAISASIMTPFIGIPCAYALVRFDFKMKNLIEIYLLSPILIPSIIIGISLLNFFVSLAMRGSFISILVCHILLGLPYIMRTVVASLSGLNIEIEEAAATLGANRFVIFTKITLPMMASGVIAGVLFVFVISFGELNASLFVTGPKTVTLPVQIFSYLQWNSSPVIAAISTIQILFIFIAALAIDKVLGLGKAIQTK